MYTPEEKNAINFKNKDIDRMSQSERMSQSDSEDCDDGWPGRRKKRKCQAGKTKRNWSAGEVVDIAGKGALLLGGAALTTAEIIAAKNKRQGPTEKFIKNLFNPQ